MDMPKMIGWGVTILIGYYIINAILPFFIWGLVGLAAWYIYLQYQNQQRPPRR